MTLGEAEISTIAAVTLGFIVGSSDVIYFDP